MPFWKFLKNGWDGCALLVQASKLHHSIWKILFVLGANEYQDWKAKLESAYSFILKYSKMTVWMMNLNNVLHKFVDFFLPNTAQIQFFTKLDWKIKKLTLCAAATVGTSSAAPRHLPVNKSNSAYFFFFLLWRH